MKASFWTAWSLSVVCLALLVAMSGCAGVPRSLSLDPTFTPSETAAIQDARDQWCSAKGWCPDFVTDGEWHMVRLTGDGPLLPGQTRVGSSHTDHAQSTTFIDGDLISDWPEMTWLIVAHELGHVQDIDHHGAASCTMSEQAHTEPSFELTCE